MGNPVGEHSFSLSTRILRICPLVESRVRDLVRPCDARDYLLPALCLAVLSPLCLSLLSYQSCIALVGFLLLFQLLARCTSPHLLTTSMLDGLDLRAGACLSLCAGTTALILQTHHPKIAFAVQKHSYLHARPFRRLLRTFLFVELALNGSATEKEQTACWLRWTHRSVKGAMSPDARSSLGIGKTDAEYGYTEELKAYVLQTMTWATIEFCNRFGRRLDTQGLDSIVLQYTCVGWQLGVPPALLATDFTAFSAQFASRLSRIAPASPFHDDFRQREVKAMERVIQVAGTSWTLRLLLHAALLIGHDLLPPELKTAYRPDLLQGRMAPTIQRVLLAALWLVYPSLARLPLRGLISLFCVLDPGAREVVELSLREIHAMDVATNRPAGLRAPPPQAQHAVPDYVHWLQSRNDLHRAPQPLLRNLVNRILVVQTSSRGSDFKAALAKFPLIALVDICWSLWEEIAYWIAKRRVEWLMGRVVHSHGGTPPVLPNHVGCIMDGNRRYARSRHASLGVGHAKGALVAVRLIGWWLDFVACKPEGPRVLTLWAFSSDNFKRSHDEVHTLFDLMSAEFGALAFSPVIHLSRMRVRVIGSRAHFPTKLLQAIDLLESSTAAYDALDLQLAVGYGGRDEIVESVKRVLASGVPVTEQAISQQTFCARNGVQPVDLILRTSERRTSGFFLWDTQGAELHFVRKLWPEVDQLDWLRALESFATREQRYGV